MAPVALRRHQTFWTPAAQLSGVRHHSGFHRASLLGSTCDSRRVRTYVAGSRTVLDDAILAGEAFAFGDLFEDGVARGEIDFVGRLSMESCVRHGAVVFRNVERDELLSRSREVRSGTATRA